MTQVCIHHQKNFPLRGAGTRHYCARQSELCSVLFDQTNWLTLLQSADLLASGVGGMVIDEQNFPKRNSARGNLRNQRRDIFLFVQSRNNNRDGIV